MDVIQPKKISHVTFDVTDGIENLSCLEKSRLIARQITEHIILKAFIIILIVIDICVVIVLLISEYNNLNYISFILSCIFVVEVSVRIFGIGCKSFFHNWINAVDFVIVVASLLLNIAVIIIDICLIDVKGHRSTGLITILRLFRIPRLFNVVRILANKNNYLNASRYVTSENKRRFRLDGYDLDLCYVTDRVIAMSFPSSGLTSLYRNSICDVADFFNSRHRSAYRIYNLCEEKGYDTKIFNDQVERYMITDHNVPRLEEILKFVRSTREWLSKSKNNVIAVHCRGGKGRTGTMICVHLIDNDVFENADLCLQYFGHRRTDLLQGKKFQGVETPSQSRYVRYYAKIKNELGNVMPESKNMIIDKIVIHSVQGIYRGSDCNLRIKLIQGNVGLIRETNIMEFDLNDQDKCCAKFDQNGPCKIIEIGILNCPKIHDDVKIKVFSSSKNVPVLYEDCTFFFWFHTAFIENNLLSLTRDQLDNPHRKAYWNFYNADFRCDVFFKSL